MQFARLGMLRCETPDPKALDAVAAQIHRARQDSESHTGRTHFAEITEHFGLFRGLGFEPRFQGFKGPCPTVGRTPLNPLVCRSRQRDP